MAKARDIPGLDGQHPFRATARAAVTIRAQEMWDHAAGVLDTEDIDRVHDMRVATRRLRAVLEVFAPAFDRKQHRRVLKDVKALADALGARRDPDVQLAALDEIAEQLPAGDQPGLEAFAARVRAEQGDGNEILAAALWRAEDPDLRGRIDALVADADADAAAVAS
jgi:CHAD domain-containing protein